MKKSLTWIIKTESRGPSVSQPIPRRQPGLQALSPSNAQGWVPFRKEPRLQPIIYAVHPPPGLLLRVLWPFCRLTVHWGAGPHLTFWGLLDTGCAWTAIPGSPRHLCAPSLRAGACGIGPHSCPGVMSPGPESRLGTDTLSCRQSPHVGGPTCRVRSTRWKGQVEVPRTASAEENSQQQAVPHSWGHRREEGRPQGLGRQGRRLIYLACVRRTGGSWRTAMDGHVSNGVGRGGGGGGGFPWEAPLNCSSRFMHSLVPTNRQMPFLRLSDPPGAPPDGKARHVLSHLRGMSPLQR